VKPGTAHMRELPEELVHLLRDASSCSQRWQNSCTSSTRRGRYSATLQKKPFLCGCHSFVVLWVPEVPLPLLQHEIVALLAQTCSLAVLGWDYVTMSR